MHKTFYEVVDVETGEAWRWPGQLWHAAGFISCIYFGLLGIQYDGKGMTVGPVPQKHVERIDLGGASVWTGECMTLTQVAQGPVCIWTENR